MDVLDEIREADTAWKRCLREADRLRDVRAQAVRRAHAAGYRPSKIAEVLGVSAGRITQLIGSAKE